MSGTALVCLYYPHQLLPAIAAVFHYRRLRGLSLTDPVVLCVWSHQTASLAMDGMSFVVITNMVASIPFIKLLKLDAKMAVRAFSSKRSVLSRARSLQKILGANYCSQLFYAHDVSGDFTAQVLMQAFPNAQRICYGDSMGLVYSNRYFESLTYQTHLITGVIKNYLAKWKRRYQLPSKRKLLDAQTAILILPSDPSGDFLINKEVLIPRHDEVMEVVACFEQGMSEFYQYLATLIYPTAKKRYLFILSNLTGSRITTQSNEVALYDAVVRQYVEKDSILIFKLHPGSDFVIKKLLTDKLNDYCEIQFFSEEFNAVPIELAVSLINACHVLSLSYASLSLPYLHNAKVTHVLDDALIKHYVNAEKVTWMSESNKQYIEMIAALKQWDGQSVLYAGEFK